MLRKEPIYEKQHLKPRSW